MSATQERRAEWLEPVFWERLDRLESRHRKIQSEHETARRLLERASNREAREDLSEAWRHYCDVIAELDQSAAELEAFRSHPL